MTDAKESQTGRQDPGGPAAEGAAQERMRFQSLVLDRINDAVVAVDAALRVTYFNSAAERQYGVSAGEAIGRPLREVYEYRWARPDDEAKAAEALARDGFWRGENIHVRRDGTTLHVESAVSVLRDEAGEPSGLLAVIRDVTSRTRAEEALREAHDSLERRVGERTGELQEMAGTLLVEVKERAAAEALVRELLRRLVIIQEAERLHIARNIHDDLGQQMTALRLYLERLGVTCGAQAELAAEVRGAQELAEELDRRIDFVTWELRPAALEHLGLSAALATLVRGWAERFRVAATYKASGVDDLRLPPEVEANLYRVAQEALHNVYKHAGAARVGVFFERQEGRVVLIVEDDGRGFDPDRATQGGGAGGLGLVGMRERAALVGGEFEVESSPGAGTTVYVRVPLREGVAGGGAGYE